jgi:polyribonucleotide nucleotidyltransferase
MGPSLQLGVGKLANLTHRSVIGNAGSTVVLATVSRESTADADDPFLTVEYKQRTAAIGKFPQNGKRSDSGRPTDAEILSGRAIDRSLRPVFKTADIAHFHVAVTVQAASEDAAPVVTALNAAVSAIYPQLVEPVAATSITILSDGRLLQDASPHPEALGELLFVGTKEKVVMLEYTAFSGAMPEDDLQKILEFAQASIQPYLETIEELQKLAPATTIDFDSEKIKLRSALGLPNLANKEATPTSSDSETEGDSDASTAGETAKNYKTRQELLDDVVPYCSLKLSPAIHKLFGYINHRTSREEAVEPVFTHDDTKELLSKTSRGMKEQVIHEEIRRLVDEYCHDMLIEFASDGGKENTNANQMTERDRNWIYKEAIYRLIKQGLWETSIKYGTRADGRKGTKLGQAWKTIRPLTVKLPALPDCVHGSAAFARGDTQVLCTVTLGAPSDGQPARDPFRPSFEKDTSGGEEDAEEKFPIGSLRFLRTQEATESDLNTRKVKADKERTGDSGILAEVKRAFLQYDFPSYSTGTVSTRKGGIDRRAIGHGSLAERAILPTLPDQHVFPYSIRMTSEVTDSNGSSSMASVCGSSLALLDAGVPVKDLAAGVSVGLALDTESKGGKPSLLLDITGTEDHVSTNNVHDPWALAKEAFFSSTATWISRLQERAAG